MKVFDIMSEHIVTVGLGEPVAAAARLLKQYNIGAGPVGDERGNLRGMITDRDIAVRCVANGLSPAETKTGDIMTMPGLPKVPAAEKIDVDENGRITGLF